MKIIIVFIQFCWFISGGYQFLYNMAHEFNRYSELAREAARMIEDSSSSLEDMYGLDCGDLD